MTEDEMVGWHHQLNGHEFEQIPGDSEGQGSLAGCSTWGRKELDTTEQLYKIWHQRTGWFRSGGSWQQLLWGLVSSRVSCSVALV